MGYRADETAWGEIRTRKGVVKYDQEKRFFSINSVTRILEKLTSRITLDEIRTPPVNSHTLTLKIMSDNLYHGVWDMFEPYHSPQNISTLKEVMRDFNDNIVDAVSLWFTQTTGSVPAGWAMRAIGRLINRGVEYMFTGSTGL